MEDRSFKRVKVYSERWQSCLGSSNVGPAG